jgi:hypothetical protein
MFFYRWAKCYAHRPPFKKKAMAFPSLKREKTIPLYRNKIKAFSLLESTIKSLGDLELSIKK